MMKIDLEGFIKTINSNFGIIETESGLDYFFTSHNLINDDIQEGDKVSFNLNSSEKNKRTEAINIDLIQKHLGLKKFKKNKFQFTDKTDFYLAVDIIKEKLNIQLENLDKFENTSEIETEISYIFDLIDDLINGAEPNINSIDMNQINIYEPNNSKRNDHNYWLHNFNLQDFVIKLLDLGRVEPKKSINKDYEIVWGEWRDKTKQIFKSGYDNKYFDYSYAEPGEIAQTHVYSKPPKPTEWDLKPINQKGLTFYISSAPVNQIAQSSYVPSLPPIMNVYDTAKRVLDEDYIPNEWQRKIDTKRVFKIKNFIEDSDNVIANTPMLFINNKKSAIIKNNKLIINYESFLEKETTGYDEGKYIDRRERDERDSAGNKIYKEFRPLWLIDGQHRVKGIHISDSQEMEIPIIIFPNDFGRKETGKVFAEINTLQKPLNPLHQLFMQHRFNIDHVSNKRKFRNYREIEYVKAQNRSDWSNGKDWEHSRANHLAYELAAMLSVKGALKNKIQFLPQNDLEKTFVSADQWVNYSRELFYSKCYSYRGEGISKWISKPSKEQEKMNEAKFFYTEMDNYFKAWIEICNHEEWNEEKEKSWVNDIDKMKRRGLIQRRSNFIILLEIYSKVRNKATTYINGYQYDKRILEVEDFKKALNVFKWVDWTNRLLKETYKGGGEKPRRSLEAWMNDAILHGETYLEEEVHNEDANENKSLPGRGICSYLGKPKIEIVSNNKWPSKGKIVSIKSKRPFNARHEATWSVLDKKDNLIEIKKSSCREKDKLDTYSDFTLKYQKSFTNLKYLKIMVEWENVHTRKGHNFIKLQKTPDLFN